MILPASAHDSLGLFATVLDTMAQGLCVFDRDSRLVVCNRQYADIYRLSLADVQAGTTLRAIVARRYESGSAPLMERADYERWREGINDLPTAHDSVVALQDGRTIAVRHQPFPGGGWLATHEDITARLETERRLGYLASHDAITGLPNRAAVCDDMQRALTDTITARQCTTMLIGVDRLQLIDDPSSSNVRDTLLREVARRLRQHFRGRDLVGHVATADFVVVLRESFDPARALHLGDEVLDLIARPIEHGGRSITLGAGVGIAAAPATDAEALLAQAAIALHRAQQGGNGRCRVFEPAMDALLQERRTMESDLRDAVRRMNFHLEYQPQVRFEPTPADGEPGSGTIVSFEALLRWTHPVRGAIKPADFIPLAEELGLIARIGAWVLDRACADCAAWPNQGAGDDAVGVAVNVSACQFESADLPTEVRAALARHDLRPDRLEVEITESCIIADPARAAETMRELRAIGVRVAMDDFGTGYSSLGYVADLPFDRIKIDRTFVARLEEDPKHVGIVRAVIGLCHSLGVAYIAEGVETPGQLALLAQEGCRDAQGYLLGRPCPARDVAALLGRRSVAAMALPRPFAVPISFERVVQATNDVIIVTDAKLDLPGPEIIFVNDAFTRLTGFSQAEAIGRSPRMLQGPGTQRATLDEIRASLAEGREVHRKVLNYAKSGEPYWLDLRIAPLRDPAGRVTQFVAIERDVTLDKRRLDELEHVADRDTLTGIPNRRSLLRSLQAELAAVPPGGRGPCLAYVDVDHFKRINDEHGHPVGDMVLFGVADRLAENMRKVDIAGRIGGEEFAVCMPAVTLQEATAIASRLRRAIAAEPFDTPVGPLRATVSVGIAAARDSDGDIAELIARADQAMYAAKRAGRNRVIAEHGLMPVSAR